MRRSPPGRTRAWLACSARAAARSTDSATSRRSSRTTSPCSRPATQRYAPELKRHASATSRTLGERAQRDVTLAGIVTALRERVNKSGGCWGVITLEDLTGTIEVCFSKVYEQAESMLKTDDPILIKGSVVDEDALVIKFRAEEVTALNDIRLQKLSKLALKVDASAATPERLKQLRDLIAVNPGAYDVYRYLASRGRRSCSSRGDPGGAHDRVVASRDPRRSGRHGSRSALTSPRGSGSV